MAGVVSKVVTSGWRVSKSRNIGRRREAIPEGEGSGVGKAWRLELMP